MDPDLDQPDNPTHQFAQFGGGCFWGVELAFQRLPGVVKTEVGYSQGNVPDPNYKLICTESKEAKQLELKDKKIVTEILPAKRFYRAEEYHQQYLEKGGGRGSKQSAAKGCNDPIRCYG
ncbi:Peptide methionine sulfoxide reductase (Fragment) [Linum perenne]